MSVSDFDFEALLRKVAEAPPVPLDLPLEIGLTIGRRYRVLGRLGKGAMGGVYRAIDEELGEEIALKLLHQNIGRDSRSLRREVRLARRVSHPNVCRVHDLGVDGEHTFVTMELLRGDTLRKRLPAMDDVPLGRRIDVLQQIASGLAAAHRAGVVHGDVKPENVVLDGSRAVLTDFGVASLALSSAPVLAGTPAYMAPEVLERRPSDRRIDTFAFGVLAYEVLAGRRPRRVETMAEAERLAPIPIELDPLPRRLADREVRSALESVLAMLVAAAPEDRPDPIDRAAALLSRAAVGVPPRRPKGATHVAERAVTALWANVTDVELAERWVTDLGGTPVQSGPSSVAALFGAPRSRVDDAIRAARAALAICQADARSSAAVHTGRARLLAPDRAEGTALDKARAAAVSRGARCTAPTRAQLATHFVLEPSAADGCASFRDRGADDVVMLTPFVGRFALVEKMDNIVETAFAGRRSVSLRVLGEGGIGKTRVVEELLDRIASRRDVEIVTMRAAPYADPHALSLLQQVAPNTRSGADFRTEMLARATRRPVVVVADDLQWADSASREALLSLEALVEDLPLATIVIARHDFEATNDTATITVGPLEADESRALLAAISPNAEASASSHAVASAQGNPFILEELARALRAGHKALPESAVAAAQVQFDRLDPDARRMAAVSALLGIEFSRSELDELADTEDQTVDELVSGGVVRARGAAAFEFTSTLVHQVAYAQLSDVDKRALHLNAATLFESAGDHQRAASHLERAGRRDAACAAYLEAGRRALGRHSLAEASSSLGKAAALAETETVEMLVLLGRALEHVDGAAAEDHLRRAFDLLSPDDGRTPTVCLLLGRLAAARSEIAVARSWFERGLSALEGRDADVTTRAGLLSSLGNLLGYNGDENAVGLPMSEAAVELLRDTPHRRELASALSKLGGNYMRAGRWRDQLACNQEHLEIAALLDDRLGELTAHVNLGVVHASLGEIETALEHTQAALAVCAETGNSRARSVALSNMGILLIDLDDAKAAEDRVRRAIDLGTAVGYDIFFYEAYAGLCRLRYLDGDLAGAEEFARTAVGVAIAANSEVSEGITLRFLAATRAAQGHRAEALAHIGRSHQCLRDRDRYEDARTTVVEARILGADSGVELLASAEQVFEELGAKLDLKMARSASDLR